MSRILLPITVSAAAFAVGWLLVPSSPDASPRISPKQEDARSAFAGEGRSPIPAAFGLARRSRLLLETEVTDPAAIRRLFEGSRLDSPEIYRLARIWAQRDPAGLWQWLDRGGQEKLNNVDLTDVVFTEWVKADAAGAIAAYRRIGPGNRWEPARSLLRSMLGGDEGLRQRMLPYLEELAVASGGALEVITDPPATAATLMKWPAGPGRDSLLASVGQYWMDSDWKAASAWAAEMPEPAKSTILAGMVGTALNPNTRNNHTTTDAKASYADPECFAWAKKWFTTDAPAEVKVRLGGQFVSSLAATDPAAALDWATENLSARPLTQAIGKVLAQQLKQDPEAARALVEGLPPGGLKQNAAFSAVSKPTEESVTWLISQADPKNVQGWYKVAAEWAFQDPAAYRAYLEKSDTARLPGYLVTGGLDNLIRKDAPGTMEWAVRTQTPGTAGSALQNWSGKDAPAAALWLGENPLAPLSAKSLAAVADRYFQHTPAAAVDWAAALPAGPNRDAALESVRRSLETTTILKPETRDSLKAALPKS